MNIKNIVRVGVIATLFAAGTAFAQVYPNGVIVSTSPVLSSVSPGSSVNLGTVTISNPQAASVNVSALPITITPGGGAAASHLSNCQLFNSGGASITTGGNVVNAIGSGANVFTFNSPIAVSNASGSTTLTLRCDVSSGAPSGSTFVMSVAQPMFNPAFTVNLDTAPSVPAGSQDVTLANIQLFAWNSAGATTNVSSIPVMVTAGNFGSTANLTDCRIRSTGNLSGSLSNATVLSNGAQTSFSLLAPLSIFSGFVQSLALTCDVAPAAAVGSTFAISVDPNAVTGVNASTGAVLTPVSGGSIAGTVIVSSQVPGAASGSGTPGIPNTGAGGDLIQVMYVLTISGLIALGGYAYLRSRVR
ncbi:hypothetical protein HY970_01955 [Candidatus Kaiserbacteria bacterium]|nr:hypothetical protein [Candidatus Kaiserbacteria bacterium]